MTKHMYFIAGEPSGDQLGGQLIEALKRHEKKLKLSGVGGHLMQEQGVNSLFPISDISVMGLAEILPHIFKIKQRIQETVADILAQDPDVLVTIDSPGFTLRVIKALRKKGFKKPVVHYVAPTVWAWKPKRAKKMAGLVDHLLCLLPFEPPYFEVEGLPTTFVGHSVLNLGIQQAKAAPFYDAFNIQKDREVIVTLLGSRKGEILRHAPVFKDVAERLVARHPKAVFVLPTVPHMQELVEEQVRGWNVETHLLTDKVHKYQAYKAASLGLAVSGTVSLELAVSGTPTVVAYKMNPLTYKILRQLVSAKYGSLVNLLEDQEILPEFVQSKCVPEKIYQKALSLLDNANTRKTQLEGCKKAIAQLKVHEKTPGDLAANTILGLL